MNENIKKKEKRKEDKRKEKNNSISKPQSVQPFDYAVWILKNIIAVLFVYFTIQYLIDKQPSYNWVYNILMKENYKTIKKYKSLSLDQKWEGKLGYDYAYWKYLHDNTPEDAVILYPTSDIFFPEGKKTDFERVAADKIQALRFLYPRKLVYHNETETNRYGKQLTHVAIANGWGYEYLEYTVVNKVDNTVLPIKQHNNQINTNK
jgi:hypothetical protein